MKTLEKQQAVALRGRGLSYREIQKVLSVSRSSLSRWLRDIGLTEDQQARIHQKNVAIRRKFVEFNDNKRIRCQAEKRATMARCANDVGSLSARELQLLGAGLYWAEGCKSDSTSVVEFVNSDLAMIALMMRWLRICCRVPEQKLRARVQLHDAGRVQDVERFWSQITSIPVRQFTKPILKLSSSSQRKRGNILPYGTFHIRISDVRLLTKIRGWIEGLKMAPSSSPAQDVSFSG